MRALMTVAALAAALAQNPFARLFTAQLPGTVAGTVRDVSGAVLPGVAVEVTNPALIEKARTAVTNSAGRYTVENLPPGAYTVTFRLAGFTTLQREGIEIAAGVTTTVNGELNVWEISEMVTGRPPMPGANSLPSQTVVCGMTVLQGGAKIDPKMPQHPPATAPKASIKVFPAPVCQK
jgi:hypothetical protein